MIRGKQRNRNFLRVGEANKEEGGGEDRLKTPQREGLSLSIDNPKKIRRLSIHNDYRYRPRPSPGPGFTILHEKPLRSLVVRLPGSASF